MYENGERRPYCTMHLIMKNKKYINCKQNAFGRARTQYHIHIKHNTLARIQYTHTHTQTHTHIIQAILMVSSMVGRGK